MDLKRILTTVIGLPLVILVFILGNKYVIGGIILIASIICIYEYFNVIKKVCKPVKWIGYTANILIVLATIFKEEILIKVVLFIIPILLSFLFIQVIITGMKTTFKDIAYTFLGIIYIPFFLMFLQLIRNLDNGKILMGYVFVISWATDIFAYLIGRNFGKHKFSDISPKKTIEGCISGIIGAIIVTLIYTFIANKLLNVEYNYLYIATITIVLSILSQIGDFAASIIKRFVDTKDYGNIIPGHGGMLDRIDSLLFIAPFAYMMFMLI